MFPSDKALIIHFVNQNPNVEDLEETINDWVLGDNFEAIKKKVASKGIEKISKNLDIDS